MMRLLGLLTLLLIVFAGVGFYLDWFKVSRQQAANEMDVTLKVDKDKIRHDTAELKKKVGELAGKDKEPAPADKKSVTGTVASIDATDRFTVTTAEDRKVQFQLDPATNLRMQELNVGERVTVSFHMENDQRIAHSITIEPGG